MISTNSYSYKIIKIAQCCERICHSYRKSTQELNAGNPELTANWKMRADILELFKDELHELSRFQNTDTIYDAAISQNPLNKRQIGVSCDLESPTRNTSLLAAEEHLLALVHETLEQENLESVCLEALDDLRHHLKCSVFEHRGNNSKHTYVKLT